MDITRKRKFDFENISLSPILLAKAYCISYGNEAMVITFVNSTDEISERASNITL
jgi:hypothetical protein